MGKRVTMWMLAIAAAIAGCNKKEEAATRAAPAPAPAPAPTPVAEGDASALPVDAQVVVERDARKADASALGTQLTVHLIEKLGGDPGDGGRIDQLLALSGNRSMVVELGYLLADAPSGTTGTRTVAPLDPPRPFKKGDAQAELAFEGPLLYFIRGRTGDLAVAQDGDAIMVWRSQHIGEDGEPSPEAEPWFVQGKIRLAPGAKVVAK